MDRIIKNAVEKIKREGAKPVSKWNFLIIKILKWSLVFLAATFSAVAVATTVFLIFQFDWDAADRLGGSFFFGFRFFPFFWLILGGLLLLGVYEAIRHTKSGYKYDWKTILVAVFGLAIGIGAIAHFADLGRKTDFAARRNVPGYGNFVHEMRDQWMNPEKGFLAGQITSLSGNEIRLEDFDGDEWKIFIDEKTLVMPMARISKGEGIKIIGEKLSDDEFKAEEIRPWMGNMMQRRFDQNEFRERYRHMGPRIKGETDEDFRPGRGMMNRGGGGYDY